MSQKLPSEAFKQEIMLKFNEDFIKNYDEDCGKGYFLKVDVEFPIFNVIDHPYQKE